MPENKSFTLMAGEFELNLDVQIEDTDLIRCIPCNTNISVQVRSAAFSGASEWAMDAVALAVFSSELTKLYNTLTGKARLTRFGQELSYIEFEALKGGYIRVHGCLTDDDAQYLTFENSFDQTYLKGFAERLLADFSCFLDKKYTKHRLYNFE